ETNCHAASCTNGSASLPVACDGSGNCPSPMTTACAPYACGAHDCLTTCATTLDCVSADYCASTSCVPRKTLGAVCATFEECSPGICRGRCCSSPCTCPQPSPQNLFRDPGFDSNISNWGAVQGGVGVQWSSQDVDGCPYSGAAEVISGNGNPSQCIAVSSPGIYNFGG